MTVHQLGSVPAAKSGINGAIHVQKLIIPAGGSYETIYTPDSGKYATLLGMFFNMSTATAALEFKFGSTSNHEISVPLAQYQGVGTKINTEFLIPTVETNQPIQVKCDQAFQALSFCVSSSFICF